MSSRIQKVNQQVKEEVGSFLQSNLDNHRGIATITAVETTSDLRQAVVWYSYIGPDLESFENELKANKSHIQRAVNSKLTMKFCPKLFYKFDKSGEYAENISKIIDEANR